MIFELTLNDLAVILGDHTEAGELAVIEVPFKNCAIGLRDSARPMHDILVKDAFTYGSARADHFGLAVEVVVPELTNGALILVNVPTVSVDAVEAICTHFQLTLIEELLLLLALVADDAHAADFALLLVVLAIFDFEKFLYSADAEILTELEVTLVEQAFEVKLVLLQILEETLIARLADKCIVDWPLKHILH